MGKPFKAVKITDKVYWVGAIDWNIRDFHGYSTNRGTTYNAYLVMTDTPALIDTVKAPFADEMLARIASVTDPKNIKVVVSNHSEMDHTGALPRTLETIKPERIIASELGVKTLHAHFHAGWKLEAAKPGQPLELGNDKLTFTEARMLHWPDSMVAFLEGESVLFSNDIFGMHLASSKRFDDETPGWKYEAAKYYANIILPYSDTVLAFIAKAKAMGLAPKLVAPDHGPIWRKDFAKILGLYAQWAGQKPCGKAVIVYDTMWGSTAQLATAIADGLITAGAETKVMPLASHHRSDIATELLEAGAFIAGAPTLNKNMFPAMADLLTYLKGLNRKNLIGAAFGSYGWSPASPAQIDAALKAMGVETAAEPLKCQYVPDDTALAQAFELGSALGKRLEALKCQTRI